MRHASAIVSTILCLGTSIVPAAAQTAADQDTTIRTTIIMRSKAADCPPGFTIFQMNAGNKLPRAAKICFIRTPKATKK